MKRICVVGGGRWGRNHIRTLDSLGELGGVVEVDSKISSDLSKEYADIQIFKNIEQAINFGFQGYTIATPAETHYSLARKALEANSHVLVEKPFTTTLDDAIELDNIAKEKKLNLMVGHVLLFHSAFKKIKDMINNGLLGEIQYLYSNRLNLGTIRTQENVFWSFAPHDIALFDYFIESEPLEVCSIGADIIQSGIHDSTITTFKYKNNIMAHIFVSWLHPFKEHRFVIVGSKGMISFEDSTSGKPLILYNKSVKVNSNNLPVPNDGPSQNIKYDMSMPLESELKYFINHLDGTPLKICNSESAVSSIKILTNVSKQLDKG